MTRYLMLAAFLSLYAVISGISGGAAAAESTGVPSPTDVRLSDGVLRAKIEEALRLDGRIKWEILDIKVNDGNVRLLGEVRTPEERGLAGHIAST